MPTNPSPPDDTEVPFSRVEVISNATLYMGDCRSVLPTIPMIDVIATDPPYPNLQGGIALKSSKRNGAGVGQDAGVTVGDPWGAALDWLPAAWSRCEAGLITFCTFHSVDRIASALEPLGAVKVGLATWDKPNAPHPARNTIRHSGELIWMFRRAGGRIDWRGIKGTVITCNGLQAGCMASPERVLQEGSKKAAHPTQKPLDVMRKLLAISPASVCDPFMGTGTTGVVCAELGIPFIGIERDPVYFDIACRRITDAQRQGSLFGAAA